MERRPTRTVRKLLWWKSNFLSLFIDVERDDRAYFFIRSGVRLLACCCELYPTSQVLSQFFGLVVVDVIRCSQFCKCRSLSFLFKMSDNFTNLSLLAMQQVGAKTQVSA